MLRGAQRGALEACLGPKSAGHKSDTAQMGRQVGPQAVEEWRRQKVEGARHTTRDDDELGPSEGDSPGKRRPQCLAGAFQGRSGRRVPCPGSGHERGTVC